MMYFSYLRKNWKSVPFCSKNRVMASKSI
jgi:hypothetical protein